MRLRLASKTKKNYGFSYIELMIVLAIFASIMIVGGASFSGLMSQQKARSVATQFQKAVRFARQEAVSRQQNVIICSSTDGMNCTNQNDQWSNGYLVFADENNDNQPQFVETLLVMMNGDNSYNAGVSLTTTAANLRQRLTYGSDGRSVNAVSGGTFTIQSNDGSTPINVIINTIGNPRIN